MKPAAPDLTEKEIPAAAENCHVDHRSRMRKRIRTARGTDFAGHELLEFLLFYALPRVNTNEQAHRLMERFGSLDAVFAASPDTLHTSEGVGNQTALFLYDVGVFLDRLEARIRECIPEVPVPASALHAKMLSAFGQSRVRQTKLVLLDAAANVIEALPVFSGQDRKDLFREALIPKTERTALVFYHPDGNVLPSEREIREASSFAVSLDALRIPLSGCYVTVPRKTVPVEESLYLWV